MSLKHYTTISSRKKNYLRTNGTSEVLGHLNTTSGEWLTKNYAVKGLRPRDEEKEAEEKEKQPRLRWVENNAFLGQQTHEEVGANEGIESNKSATGNATSELRGTGTIGSFRNNL